MFDYSDLNYNYQDGKLISDNKLIKVCFEKALKANANYHYPEILSYLIFNYLKSQNKGNPSNEVANSNH